MRACSRAVAVLAAATAATAAQAHVGVQPASAAAGSVETLSFIVGHGCDGQPTTALRVELPKGISAVEPQAKTGWSQSVEPLASGGVAVTWRGELPPHRPEGFQIRAKLPSAPGSLAFVAAQSCGAVTVRWDEPIPPGGSRPAHPAPSMTLTAEATGPSATAASSSERLPKGLRRLADGGLADAGGRPLYTFNYDTMVGMSHCEADCAVMWPPLLTPEGSKPFDAWSLIRREGGLVQGAYRDKPLYTYSRDRAGMPAAGTEAPNWKRAN